MLAKDCRRHSEMKRTRRNGCHPQWADMDDEVTR